MSHNNQQRTSNVPAAPTAQAQNRDGREQDTRESEYRIESWAPPETLPEITKKPGWSYRWVRTAAMGEEDPINVSRSYREGWSPETPDQQPHMSAVNDSRAAQRGSIEIGGLLLCKCPEKFTKQRDAYYAARVKQEQQAIDQNLMKEEDSRMPLFSQRKTKVTFGSGGD